MKTYSSNPNYLFYPNKDYLAIDYAIVNLIYNNLRISVDNSTELIQDKSSSNLAQELGLLASSEFGGGTPNYGYKNYSFALTGYKNTFTNAEGVGINGGFFYTVGGRVYQNYSGEWFVYVTASAWAPSAEKHADQIIYESSVSVVRNGNVIAKRILSDPKSKTPYIVPTDYTFIGIAYMMLPEYTIDTIIRIKVTYNMYQYFNGFVHPQYPFVHNIKF